MVERPSVESSPTAGPEASLVAGLDPIGRRIHVLHIDDDASHLDVLKIFLKNIDPSIEVMSTSSPSEVLSRLDEPFDCIVSDYRMPEMTGIELAERVRQTSSIPFILYTGHGSEEVAERAFTVGIDDYIRKEMDPSHYMLVANRIKMAVERSRAWESLRESEEKYRKLIENSLQGILIVQPSSPFILYANSQISDILGFSVEELTSLSLKEVERLIHPEDKDKIFKRLRDRLSGRPAPTRYEIRVSRKDESLVWLELFSSPVLYNGRPAVQAAFVDITDRKRMEQDLLASRARWHSLFESAPDGMALIDLKGNVTTVNRAFTNWTGVKEEDIVGRHFTKLGNLRARDLPKYLKMFASIIRGEVPEPFTVAWSSEDGRTQYSDVHISPMIEGTRKVGFQVIARIVTDHVRYRNRIEALHTSAAELAQAKTVDEVYSRAIKIMEEVLGFHWAGFAVVDGRSLRYVKHLGIDLPEGWSMPLDGPGVTVRAVNERESQLVPDVKLDPGFTDPENYEGPQSNSELAVPIIIDDRAVGVINLESVKENAFTVEDQQLLEIFAKHVASALRGLREIEKLQQSEERMREAYNRTREYQTKLSALHSHSIELLDAKTEGEVAESTFNAIERVLGYNYLGFAFVEGDRIVYRYTRGDTSVYEMPLDGPGLTIRAVKTGETQHVPDTRKDADYVSGRPEGDPESLSELDVPVKIDGRTVAVLNVESDLLDAFTEEDRSLLEILSMHVSSTLRRLDEVERLERQVREKTQELIDAERIAMAGRVAANLGHDLRGPLQTIKNSTYLLRKMPEQAEEMIALIDGAADRAAGMLDELRNQTRETPLKLDDVDLAELIQRALTEASVPERIHVDVEIDPNLGPVRIDEMKVMRVLSNLMRNAVEAMQGEGVLRLEATRSGDEALIVVGDTGSGISEDELAKLFKPFYTTKPKGLGLGLTFCMKVVEAHGGTIEVGSKVNEGTTFTMRLPAQR